MHIYSKVFARSYRLIADGLFRIPFTGYRLGVYVVKPHRIGVRHKSKNVAA